MKLHKMRAKGFTLRKTHRSTTLSLGTSSNKKTPQAISKITGMRWTQKFDQLLADLSYSAGLDLVYAECLGLVKFCEVDMPNLERLRLERSVAQWTD